MKLNKLAEMCCCDIVIFSATSKENEGSYLMLEDSKKWYEFKKDKREVVLIMPLNEHTIRVYVKN